MLGKETACTSGKGGPGISEKLPKGIQGLSEKANRNEEMRGQKKRSKYEQGVIYPKGEDVEELDRIDQKGTHMGESA